VAHGVARAKMRWLAYPVNVNVNVDLVADPTEPMADFYVGLSGMPLPRARLSRGAR
jgi:hypothetical protein